MSEDLAGRLAVVTGGASGIGAACAVRLAECGASVVVADINLGAAVAVAASVAGRAFEVDLAADFDPAALARDADRRGITPFALPDAQASYDGVIGQFPV